MLRLLRSPSNAALGQIVGAHLHGDLVTGQDADVVHTQLAGNVSQDNVTITDVHIERGVGQGFGDDALQFNHIVFSQSVIPPFRRAVRQAHGAALGSPPDVRRGIY